MRYCVWDVETTTHVSLKRKANPFDPRNKVVMSGYRFGNLGANEKPDIVGEYFGRQAPPANWFIKLLDGTKLLVGQNIKFDLLYALQDPVNLAYWMKWVSEGGMVWDIQLGEYLLEGMDQTAHMMSLDELAPIYGGNVKIDEVKVLWDAGVDTLDIDPDLLRDYLIGYTDEAGVYQEGDIGNTELVFLGQIERAKQAKQVKSIWLNMGALICTVEMERNGMKIDVVEAERQRVELSERLAALTVELAGQLPPNLPFDFSWTSHYHKSAMIFGGTINYKKRTPALNDDGSQAYTQKDMRVYYLEGTGEQVREDDPRMADETWRVLNLQTFTSGKKAGEYKGKTIKVDDLDRPKSAMRDFQYSFPGVTEPYEGWKMTLTDAVGDPLYSTSAEVIDALGNRDIPFLKSLQKVSGLAKDLSTYYRVYNEDKDEWTGMLTLVDAEGLIHHSLNMTSTVTARLSSSNPNLQNIPTGGKSTVKTVFVSRFKDGYIIQSDFSSLEVYMQALLTDCYQLIQDLKAGLDMHCVRVSQKEGRPYEEVYQLCVVEKVAEWVSKRKKAKTFSFERAYGAGASSISAKNGIPFDEVEAMIEAEDVRYPEIEKFYDDLKAQIKANSWPTNRVVDHPSITGAKVFLRKSGYRTPDGKKYTYWEKVATFDWQIEQGILSSFSPTEAKNYIVQGTGGEWAKAAMWLCVRAFYARGNFGGMAVLVNQVHDAIYGDADASVVTDAAALIEACMVAANEFMEYYFNWSVKVPVPSETTYGRNMLEENQLPDGHVVKVDAFRQELRKTYMEGYIPSFAQELKYAA